MRAKGLVGLCKYSVSFTSFQPYSADQPRETVRTLHIVHRYMPMRNGVLQNSPIRTEAEDLRQARDEARRRLLEARTAAGCWEGRLSSSALATATAVSALSVVSRDRFKVLIRSGVRWLIDDQNPDGGWGDTPDSPTNLPTTVLVQAALYLSGEDQCSGLASCLQLAEAWIGERAGLAPGDRLETISELYGKDRTFAVPILANCALAGRESPRPDTDIPDGLKIDWDDIPGLPFELGCLPHFCFSALRLRVVSYALPALIAIGQLLHQRSTCDGPFRSSLRGLAVRPTLRRLERIQPESGGFLEATPLTSFVVMSLAGAGRSDNPVCRRGLDFLERSVRADGSWPIDTNLSNWLTSLAVESLSIGGLDALDMGKTREWLLSSQHGEVHPYTNSPPGGWAWTDLSGGVPDADDTSGALLALAKLDGPQCHESARLGVKWLLGLQNGDGGWPTFCRGWAKLPFDRSAADLTAHAVRAIHAWGHLCSSDRWADAVQRGMDYLRGAQRDDGSWLPLWFGNQNADSRDNPVYGTSRVLAAFRDLGLTDQTAPMQGRGFLLRAQNADGSWGGDRGICGSMEETALAIDALAAPAWTKEERAACLRGGRYLQKRVGEGGLDRPVPIGLYFARLWYSEKLYPVIWTTAALSRLVNRLEGRFGGCFSGGCGA